MDTYNLMIQTNQRLINDEILLEKEKDMISNKLLASAIITEPPERRLGEEPDSKARRTLFFTPPYNEGKKLRTIFGQMPKTHILNGNMYELEILRILCLFAQDNAIVDMMKSLTLRRLKSTCFGYHGCSLGECFDSALVVLRFLIVAAPTELSWIEKLIALYNEHYTDKKRVKAVSKYYELCISELPKSIEQTNTLAD